MSEHSATSIAVARKLRAALLGAGWEYGRTSYTFRVQFTGQTTAREVEAAFSWLADPAGNTRFEAALKPVFGMTPSCRTDITNGMCMLHVFLFTAEVAHV